MPTRSFRQSLAVLALAPLVGCTEVEPEPVTSGAHAAAAFLPAFPLVRRDFNGDGKADVMALYDYGNASAGLWIFPGTTTASGPTVPYRTWFTPGPNGFDGRRAKIATGDFNGDSRADVIALYDYGNASAGLWILPGKVDTAETSDTAYRVWFTPGPNGFDVNRAKVAAGDFNGDGKDDLIVMYRYPSGAGVWVFPGTTGTFEGACQPYRVWLEFSDRAVDIADHPVAAGDFDGDGKDDLLVPAFSTVWQFSGTSGTQQGATAPMNVWFQPIEPRWFPSDQATSGDFNGDGKDDLLILQRRPSSEGTELWIVPGHGLHAERVWYGPPTTFDGRLAKLTSGDFDGDGKDDAMVLYANYDHAASLLVWRGNDDTFGYATQPYTAWSDQNDLDWLVHAKLP